MAEAKIGRGSQSSYNNKKNAGSLDTGKMYLCIDTGNIYVGDKQMAKGEIVGIGPTSSPESDDKDIMYVATLNGTYSNFGNIEVNNEIAFITRKNGNWSKTSYKIPPFGSYKNTEYDDDGPQITASAETAPYIYLMPNAATSPTAQQMWVTVDNGVSASPRYTWQYIGDTNMDVEFKTGNGVGYYGITDDVNTEDETMLPSTKSNKKIYEDSLTFSSNSPAQLEAGALSNDTGAKFSWKPQGVECLARTVNFIHAPAFIMIDDGFLFNSVLRYTRNNGVIEFHDRMSYGTTYRQLTLDDDTYIYKLTIGKAVASGSSYTTDRTFDMESYANIDEIVTYYQPLQDFTQKNPIFRHSNGNIFEELYLEGLNPSHRYRLSGFTRSGDNITINIQESSNGTSYSTVCRSTTVQNGVVSILNDRVTTSGGYITNSNGINGYCIINLPADAVSYPTFDIDVVYCSDIENSPKIKKYLESKGEKPKPYIYYRAVGSHYQIGEDKLTRRFVKTSPIYGDFYLHLYGGYFIRSLSLYKDGEEIVVNNKRINAIQNSQESSEVSPSYKAYNHYGTEALKYHKEYGVVLYIMRGNGTNGEWDNSEGEEHSSLPTPNTINPAAPIIRDFCLMDDMVRVVPTQRNADAAYKRMYDMITTIWQTISATKCVYTNLGGHDKFLGGERLFGLPYSSVKEYNKYIGHEVSIRTFMSALRNPKSVLYTEYVAEYEDGQGVTHYGDSAYGIKYTGSNCGAYYGSVCSATTAYILGIPIPLRTAMFYYDVLREKMYGDFPCKRIRGDFESKWKWYNASSDSYLYTDRKGLFKNLGLANDQIDWDGNNYVIKDYDTSVTPYTLTVEIDGTNVQYVLDETIPSGEGGYQRILDHIEPLDIMVKSSHCTTITNIWKDEYGKVQFVEVSEMTSGLPKTTIYNANEFCSRYGDGHVLVRYFGEISPITEDTSYYRRQNEFNLDEPIDVLAATEFEIGFYTGDYSSYVRCEDNSITEYDTTTGDPIFVNAKGNLSQILNIEKLVNGSYERIGSIDIASYESDADGIKTIDLSHYSGFVGGGKFRVHLGTSNTYSYCEVVELGFAIDELDGGGVLLKNIRTENELFAVYLKSYGGASQYGPVEEDDDSGDSEDEGQEAEPNQSCTNPYYMVTSQDIHATTLTIPNWDIEGLYNGMVSGGYEHTDIYVKLMVKGDYGTVGKAIKLR